MTPDQKLQALFAEVAPPLRDYVFEAEVARRIARRRAVFSVAAVMPWAMVATCVLWGVQPLFRLLGEGLSVLNPVAMALTSALMLTVGVGLLVRRLDGRA